MWAKERFAPQDNKILPAKRASGLLPKPFFVTDLLAEPYFFLPFFETLRCIKKPAAQPTMPPKMWANWEMLSGCRAEKI